MVKRSISKKPKLKKCKVCKNEFKPWESLERLCSPRCAIEFVRLEKDNKQAKENKKALKELNDNDRGIQTEKAQTIFNRYIRLRDVNLPCVSCGRHHAGQYHAGHYRSRGAYPELRFDERNCHKQCSACNNRLSGNITNYRINLVRKIGIAEVERLEGPNPPKKYTIDDLKELQKMYKDKIRQMEKDDV